MCSRTRCNVIWWLNVSCCILFCISMLWRCVSVTILVRYLPVSVCCIHFDAYIDTAGACARVRVRFISSSCACMWAMVLNIWHPSVVLYACGVSSPRRYTRTIHVHSCFSRACACVALRTSLRVVHQFNRGGPLPPPIMNGQEDN